MRSKFASLMLRAGAILGKFILLILMAKILSPSDFGLIMLFTTAGQLGAAVASLDLYAETSRCLISDALDQKNIDTIIAKHFSFLFYSSVVVGIFSSVFFSIGGSCGSIFLILLPIYVVLEVAQNDLGRLLPAMKLPAFESAYIFVRQLPLLLIVFSINSGDVGLTAEDLIYIFVITSFVLYVLTIFWLSGGNFIPYYLSFDILWIKKSLSLCGVFFAGTLLYRFGYGYDKFLVEHYSNLSTVGSYSFLTSVGMGLLSVLESGVSAWFYPKLIFSVKNDSRHIYMGILKSFLISNFISATLIFLLAYLIVPAAIRFVVGDKYDFALLYFPIVLVGVYVLVLTLPFHYFIFAFRKDVYFMYIYTFNIIALIVFGLFFLDGASLFVFSLMFLLMNIVVSIGRVLGFLKLM